jgi:GH15 family glucan-1,4-alpha-glucosidase
VVRVDGRHQQSAIGDYGLLSDCASAAVVDRDASIEWWCVPRFDSPSVFGRLLDADAGHWSLHPIEEFTRSREYVGDTMVLATTFVTDRGSVRVTDALAFEVGARGHDIGRRTPGTLIRRIEGLGGRVAMRSEFAPRMEYGRTQPQLSPSDGGVRARGGPVELLCLGPVTWTCLPDRARSSFELNAGDIVELRLQYRPAFDQAPTLSPPVYDATLPSIGDTVAAWQSWVELHTSYDGAFPEHVRRSSLVLQSLTYQRSGALIAAATTSMPEVLGAGLTFDYRFAWLRDLSLTIRSLWLAACPDEPGRLFGWFTTAAGQVGEELVQIMYGVEGERDLTERELPNLSGYRGNGPVRVGNQAWQQKQLDVLGEVLDAAYILRDSMSFGEPVQQLLVAFADRAAAGWADPDSGMWEARDAERHYTSSKVMCWVALDRAVKLAARLGGGTEPERWASVRDEVRASILDRAWSASAGAYAGAFDSDELDASVLVLPLVGFLPAADARMWSTIEAIENQLDAGGLIRRWAADPNGFLICTYWLVECLALGGELDRARKWFERATACANDLGLLAEQADAGTGELLGNFPQAFSHVGLINAAWRLAHPEQDLAHTSSPITDEGAP